MRILPAGGPGRRPVIGDSGVRVVRAERSCSGHPRLPYRIIVAEVDGFERHIVEIVLDHHGFEVVTAPDAEAALTMITDEGADGLVFELEMPGLGGVALCRVLRELRAYVALPIVLYTGIGDGDAAMRAARGIPGLEVVHRPGGLARLAPTLLAMLLMPGLRLATPTAWGLVLAVGSPDASSPTRPESAGLLRP